MIDTHHIDACIHLVKHNQHKAKDKNVISNFFSETCQIQKNA